MIKEEKVINISTVNQIRTNQKKDTVILSENKEDDRIPASKSNCIDSLSDEIRYYYQRRSKFGNNSSFTSVYFDDIDAVEGFNYWFIYTTFNEYFYIFINYKLNIKNFNNILLILLI